MKDKDNELILTWIMISQILNGILLIILLFKLNFFKI